MSFNNRSRQGVSLPRIASLVCQSTLLQMSIERNSLVQAIGVDSLLNNSIFAQVDAELASESLSEVSQ